MYMCSCKYDMSSSVPLFSIDRRRVLMTGFEPFANYKTNPSWEAVRHMNIDMIEKKHNIILFRMEMPVTYEAVNAMVPQMWQWYQPDLAIHVGLNEKVETFVLEKRASKRGYLNPNSKENNIENPAGKDEIVYTTLNVNTICEKFNNHKREDTHPTLALPSKDAGHFVCEYTYYTSLCLMRSSCAPQSALFVHVPKSKYSTKQLAQGLERILELCLQ